MNASVTTLRDRQRQHTRAEIVRVAFDLFGKHGYENVPVELIVAEAGISRATFFNYFPQKELILREVASARAEKLKASLAELQAGEHPPTVEKILQSVLKLSEENARITLHSKRLMLDAFFHQVSRGPILAVRDQVVDALTQIFRKALKKSPSSRKNHPRRIAETCMSIYIATMLEWLMRESVPPDWLVETMRQRLELVLEGTR